LTNSEISFLFLNNTQIASFNKQYLGRDRPTDVIAFPQDFKGKRVNPEKLNLGDIIISVERAKEQAKTYSKTFDQELRLLMVHGILHLLDYDDTTPKSKKEMRRMERKILSRL